VGYAVSHPEVADLMNRVRQPFNVNSVALAAATAALADEQHLRMAREVNDEGLAYLETAFRQRSLGFIPSVANFITVHLPRPAGEVHDSLLRSGVIVRPVGGYGLPEHLRISVGTAAENERFVAALDDALSA